MNERFPSDMFAYAGLIGVFAAAFIWKKYQAHAASKVIVESSLLINLHVPGAGLTKISDGKIDNYKYNLMIADSSTTLDGSGSNGKSPVSINSALLPGNIILMLTLPFRSALHLACLGIPDKGTRMNIDQIAKQNKLEQATIEGDFPDYFSLYCRSSEQLEVRQVLDPADMAFLIDYCKRENWEIYGDSVYFSQSSMSQPDDDSQIENTTMVQDAHTFVTRILPMLERIKST